MASRVHPDGVLRASLDAEAADDASQFVDLESDRVLLDGLLVVLAGLDVDALRGAGGRAHVAGDAAGTAVEARHEPVHAPVPRRVRLALFRGVDCGDEVHPGAMPLHDLGVRVAEAEQVPEEVLGDDAHPLDGLAQVEALAETEVPLGPRAAAFVPSSGFSVVCHGRVLSGPNRVR